jgi:hypothetical protein
MAGLHVEQVRGATVRRSGQEIAPVARVARLTWRGGRVEWRRPVAIEVHRGDRAERIPIRDVTRRAQAGVIFAELALGILAVWAQRAYLRRRNAR